MQHLLREIKNKILIFFYKIKYISALFFLFYMIIDYFLHDNLSISVPFLINSFALILSLVLIIVYRRRTHISFKNTGLQINSYGYKVLFPWLYIEKPFLYATCKDKILIKLSSMVPGVSFHVKKYLFSTNGKRDRDWFQIKKDGIEFASHSSLDTHYLQRKIEKYINKLPRNTLEFDKDQDLHGIILGKTKKSKGIIALNPKACIRFPIFCPITGGDVSCIEKIASLSIPMSKTGSFLWKRQGPLRLILSLLFAFGFTYLAWLSSQSSVYTYIWGTLLLSPLYIFLWRKIRKRVYLIESSDTIVKLKIEDPEYVHALIYMNYPFSEVLSSPSS